MNAKIEKACLTLLVILCHGRKPEWVSLADPPDLHGEPPCPLCKRQAGKVRRKLREPLLDYWCARCRKVFNWFTETPFRGTHRTPYELLSLVRDIAKGLPTAKIARRNGWHRAWLVSIRRRLEAIDWLQALREGATARPRTNGVTLRDVDDLLQKAKRQRTNKPML
jgi:transposase-like protein